MLRDSSVAAVVRTRPRATPLAMITTRKSTHGFPFVSHIWDAYGAPLGGPSGRRSSAKITQAQVYVFVLTVSVYTYFPFTSLIVFVELCIFFCYEVIVLKFR